MPSWPYSKTYSSSSACWRRHHAELGSNVTPQSDPLPCCANMASDWRWLATTTAIPPWVRQCTCTALASLITSPSSRCGRRLPRRQCSPVASWAACSKVAKPAFSSCAGTRFPTLNTCATSCFVSSRAIFSPLPRPSRHSVAAALCNRRRRVHEAGLASWGLHPAAAVGAGTRLPESLPAPPAPTGRGWFSATAFHHRARATCRAAAPSSPRRACASAAV
jgi:hypothetical protein